MALKKRMKAPKYVLCSNISDTPKLQNNHLVSISDFFSFLRSVKGLHFDCKVLQGTCTDCRFKVRGQGPKAVGALWI